VENYAYHACRPGIQVNRNKQLVTELAKVIPGNRSQLTPAFVRAVRSKTGFTMVELFRK
jgi:hypothetical protein